MPIMKCHVPNDISWVLREIMGMRSLLIQKVGWDTFLFNGKFNMEEIYSVPAMDQPKVQRRGLFCKNIASP